VVRDYSGRTRDRAPASGRRNAQRFVTHDDPTWRESMIGSAYLLGAFGLGVGVGLASALVLRRRRT